MTGAKTQADRMAVLTPITQESAEALLASYGVAGPALVRGVPAGSVNSNFSLIASGARYFLRIYEERDLASAERETAMLERLAARGVPTPPPLCRLDGTRISDVSGKPAALFPWREGAMRCQASVSLGDAQRIGAALATVHVAAASEEAERGRFEYEDLLLRLSRIEGCGGPLSSQSATLRDALRRSHEAREPGLPSGLTHGDLFRDNVLWDARGEIAALLDFESACRGTYAYDLMVCALAWCVGDDLDVALARAMVHGYRSVRSLTPSELRGMWAEGCFAALRFTITRITDFALRDAGNEPRVVKDWARFWKRYARLIELGPAGLAEALDLETARCP